jgi:hypothetical protein
MLTHAGKEWVVEKHVPGVVLPVHYILREATGVAGEKYGLLRSGVDPTKFFAVNMRSMWVETPFDRVKFEECGGTLVIANG